MTAPADLAALLGSRICHDLISPLGAIGNGVELLMLDGGHDRPEIALIADSVASANARIRFLRVAFGMASAEQNMGAAEIAGLLADANRGTRYKVDWQVPGDPPRAAVRRACLALMCIQGALPLGGTIAVTRPGPAWLFEGEGRVRVDPGLWSLLTEAEAATAIGAPQVQFGLLREDLLAHTGPARLEAAEDRIRLSYGA